MNRHFLLGGLIAAVTAVAVATGLIVFGVKAPFIPRPAKVVEDPDRSEKLQSDATGWLKKTFGKAIRDRDFASVAALLTPEFAAEFPADGEGEKVDEPGVQGVRWRAWRGKAVDGPAFVTRLAKLLDIVTVVERLEFRPYEFLAASDERSAVATYHWKVSGRSTAGSAELKGDLEVEYVRASDGWKLRRLALPSASRFESTMPAFADVTDATGFEFAFARQGRDAIQLAIDGRANAFIRSIGTVDWNRDGFPDLFVSYPHHRSLLFLNDGRGGFLPQELPEEGAPFLMVLDLDGDGTEELISTRVSYSKAGRAALSLYVRKGDGWEERPDTLVFESRTGGLEINYYHVATGDVDGDGDLDLFCSGYSDSSSYSAEFDYFNAQTGIRDLLFINQGGLRFTEEGPARGIQDTQYAYVAEMFDFDGDRDLDIFVVNDFGPDILYWNDGKGAFRKDTEHLLTRGTAYGMGVSIADYDNEGDWKVHVSNMYSHAGNRIVPLAKYLKDPVRDNLLFAVQGNMLYERKGGRWSEVGVDRGINFADWAWGCVFFDLDNDRDKDLFVTNGFTTHSNPTAPDQ